MRSGNRKTKNEESIWDSAVNWAADLLPGTPDASAIQPMSTDYKYKNIKSMEDAVGLQQTPEQIEANKAAARAYQEHFRKK